MALVMTRAWCSSTSPLPAWIRKCRREIYDIIEELKKEKKTILLTTHYIEEASACATMWRSWTTARSSPWAATRAEERSGAVTRITVRMARAESNGALEHLKA